MSDALAATHYLMLSKSTFLPTALLVALAFTTSLSALPPAFQKLELIEEIDVLVATKSDGSFREFPEGASRVETVLGEKVRVLPNDTPGVKYFGYLMGKGKGLKANESYVLEIEYPEDKPRSLVVINRGNEVSRGFYTGNTIGDCLNPRYVNNSPESLEIPLSGAFEKSQMLMRLQDKTSVAGGKRGAELLDDSQGARILNPEDGFWVYISQFEPAQDPLSNGAAVSKIRLYKAPPFDSYALTIKYPPADLPRRHLFYREEMGDGMVGKEASERGFVRDEDYYIGKAELMRFLGMNTFAKDLLEFGANQGWDSTKFGSNKWVYQSHAPKRWEQVVDIAKKYNLSVLPYYEYAGSKGEKGLGPQKRAIPLVAENYTHIGWTETSRADLTDPETFEDFRKMLEITIVDLKDKADFVGAWLRPRSSQLPISFSDGALDRFSKAKKSGAKVTRDQLKSDKKLYAEYLLWWNDARKEFLNKIHDYLVTSGIKGALVFYTADPAEAWAVQPGGAKGGLVAENPEAWTSAGVKTPPVSLKRAVDERWSYEAQTQPHGTWGKWEWQHAVPSPDPANYQSQKGVLPTFTFNRAYTVADSAALKEWETQSGMAMIRHFSLNENMLRVEKGKGGKDLDPLGYFVADMELAGPYMMLAEAQAMANGNPTAIGYLASNNFNRSFPQYARAFNAAFLALPALPSKIVDGAASDPEVVVRRIDGGKHGTWIAIINPSYSSKKQVKIKLPIKGRVTDATTGKEVPVKNGFLVGNLSPCQLISLHIR